MKTWLLARLQGVDRIGAYCGLLSLRILLAWDFFESGQEKLWGENWFADIQADFPFPFDRLPVDLSWSLATWFELIGAVALLFGLATRFFSLALIVLTGVAIAAVHWPAQWSGLDQLMQGYVLSDQGFGNFKLPVLFIGMFLPLLCLGPGKLSLDAWLRRRFVRWAGAREE